MRPGTWQPCARPGNVAAVPANQVSGLSVCGQGMLGPTMTLLLRAAAHGRTSQLRGRVLLQLHSYPFPPQGVLPRGRRAVRAAAQAHNRDESSRGLLGDVRHCCGLLLALLPPPPRLVYPLLPSRLPVLLACVTPVLPSLSALRRSSPRLLSRGIPLHPPSKFHAAPRRCSFLPFPHAQHSRRLVTRALHLGAVVLCGRGQPHCVRHVGG